MSKTRLFSSNASGLRPLADVGSGRVSVRRVVGGFLALMVAAAGIGAALEPAESEVPEPPLVEQKLDISPATMPDPGTQPWREVRPLPPEYQILLTRSIFSKLPIAPDRDDAVGAGPTRAELDYVLRGVATQAGTLTAFVENSRKGRMFRLRPGDRIARGKLRTVSFGGVDYECNGAVIQVAIGCAFDGTRQAPMPAPSTQPDSDGADVSPRRARRPRAGTESLPPTERPKSSADAPNEKAR